MSSITTRMTCLRKLEPMRVIVALLVAMAGPAMGLAMTAAAPVQEFSGVYRMVENPTELPNGLKNVGSPLELPLTDKALKLRKSVDLKDDSANLCLPVGPLRMMAWKDNAIDVYPSTDRVIMLFEDMYAGHMRTIYTNRREHSKDEPAWQGDSIGRWEHGEFIVETVNFNSSVWLNEQGAPHGANFRLTERYKPLQKGNLLEVSVTATDPEMLTRPYTYVRYYRKSNLEIQERICWKDVQPLKKQYQYQFSSGEKP